MDKRGEKMNTNINIPIENCEEKEDISTLVEESIVNNKFSYVHSFDNALDVCIMNRVTNKINDEIKEKNYRLKFIYETKIAKQDIENDRKEIIRKLQSLGETYNMPNKWVLCTFNKNTIIESVIEPMKDFINLNIIIFCNSIEDYEETKCRIQELFPEPNIVNVNIHYYTINSRQTINSIHINEKIDETYYDESYPFIIYGIKNFVYNFINSDENVLILLGPPGTGKTKFIRYVLREFEIRNESKNEDFNVMYTNNSKVMDLSDDLFLNFIADDNNVLVLEDIDFHLNDRKSGNHLMYKLLGSSDGLITTKNKIIISTNIDSESKIDEALRRPGRCFDLTRFRKLDLTEANNLLEKMEAKYKLTEDNYYTLSEIYKFYETGKIHGYNQKTKKVSKGTGFI